MPYDEPGSAKLYGPEKGWWVVVEKKLKGLGHYTATPGNTCIPTGKKIAASGGKRDACSTSGACGAQVAV